MNMQVIKIKKFMSNPNLLRSPKAKLEYGKDSNI